MKETNPLVIAPHYKYFIKGSIDAIAKHVPHVTVSIRYNPLSELARYIPLPYFRHVQKYSRKNLVDLTKKPDNVDINLISLIYFLPDGRNKVLGDKLARQLKRHIQQQKIEFNIVHAHFIWPSGYAAAKLAKEFNVPLIITAHGYDVYDLPFRDRNWFKRVKYALDTAEHIITVSNSNREILVGKLGVPENKVSVIPNGFDPRLFHPMDKVKTRKKLDLPLDRKIILNVANLVPVKGHGYLIRAMVSVVKERREVLLVIVGGGPLYDKLKEMVRRLGLEGNVMLVGPRPHEEIPLWMNAADLFVLPSLNEGNPTVMFEVLGVGLPFVGTAVGGVPEVITSEDYGLLCPPWNLDCLAEKILMGLKKEWDREKIREYAEQFTWDNVAKRIAKIYGEVMSK